MRQNAGYEGGAAKVKQALTLEQGRSGHGTHGATVSATGSLSPSWLHSTW